MIASVKQPAPIALASSGRALTEQWPSSERAANQVEIPVKIRPSAFPNPLMQNHQGLEARVGIEQELRLFSKLTTSLLPPYHQRRAAS